MTVGDLIIRLQRLSPNDRVFIYDADSEKLEEVSGLLCGGNDGVIELCSDDNQ